jgi:hypothetical protein
MTSKAQQNRQLARHFHFMARSLPHGENRTTLLKMAEECERLADQQQSTDPRQEGPMVPARPEGPLVTPDSYPARASRVEN